MIHASLTLERKSLAAWREALTWLKEEKQARLDRKAERLRQDQEEESLRKYVHSHAHDMVLTWVVDWDRLYAPGIPCRALSINETPFTDERSVFGIHSSGDPWYQLNELEKDMVTRRREEVRADECVLRTHRVFKYRYRLSREVRNAIEDMEADRT